MDDSWAREWIEDYGEAWRSGDADALAELFAQRAVYRSSPFRPATEGREAIRFAGGGRCEELREYWHLQDGQTDPPDGWGR